MWNVWEQKYSEFVGNPEGIRQLWRLKCRLENNIKVGLEETCGRGWSEFIWLKDQWRVFVNTAMKLLIL